MNVAVKQNDPKESKAGGQTRFYSLVTTRSFKAGEEIYKAGLKHLLLQAYLLFS